MLSVFVEDPAEGDEAVAIEPQSLYGGTARRSQPDDAGEVMAPDEVVLPALVPRMEESLPCSGHRIQSPNLDVLVVVAALTGVGEVLQVVRSPGLEREDVLDGEYVSGKPLLASAVFAERRRAVADHRPRQAAARLRHPARAPAPTAPSGPA